MSATFRIAVTVSVVPEPEGTRRVEMGRLTIAYVAEGPVIDAAAAQTLAEAWAAGGQTLMPRDVDRVLAGRP